MNVVKSKNEGIVIKGPLKVGEMAEIKHRVKFYSPYDGSLNKVVEQIFRVKVLSIEGDKVELKLIHIEVK